MNGPVSIILVHARTGEYYARVRWTPEIRPYEQAPTITFYTRLYAEVSEALGYAAGIIATGKGLASPPPTR